MRKKAIEIGLHFKPVLTPGTMEMLVDYDWPGNVRELSNVLERAIIIHGGKPLSFEDIVGIPLHNSKQALHNRDNNDLTLSNVEAQHIRVALKIAGGKVEGEKGAAEILGINPGTLRHRMRRLGIPFGRTARVEHGKF
jgi:DNA-binding NtrC family response regulator